MKVADLEEKVDLYSYISEKHSISRVGRSHRINPCPVCGSKDHFTIFPETNSYSSFSNCCNGGSVYKYLQEVEKLDDIAAYKKLHELASGQAYEPKERNAYEITELPNEIETDFTELVLKRYERSERRYRNDMLEVFYKRGITINEIMKYKLSVYRDQDGKRAMFPIWSKGKVVYYEARALEGQKPKYKKPKGVANHFFNMDYLDEPQDKAIFITEGIMDALSLEHLGFKAISINGVQNVNRFLETVKEKPNVQDTVFITAFDNDEAGKNAAEKLPFKPLVIPSSNEDVNEWLISSYKKAQEADTDELEIKVNINEQLETITDSDVLGEILKRTQSDVNESFVFPKGYISKSGCLYRIVEKEVRGEIERHEVFICRQTPIITQSFMNVEFPQLYHEVTWTDKGKVYKEIIPAGDLAIKRELLKLSYKSLAVNDNNAKELITYFDRLNMINRSDHGYLVERLGHIKNTFIHPLQKNSIKIMPTDIGEKQTLEAFQQSGTSEEWLQNVLEPIKKHSKALLMVLASFTSVIIKDLKIQPFVVDFSGPTSRGKTTILRVAASIWGSEHLVNEWNLTPVAAERKAAFLNSFPLILDDSRKAQEKKLQEFVYQYSGGRSKGRGSISGSQREFTWNNILLSTGESALTEYAEHAGGVAARIISITGIPFENVDFNFFNDLYHSIGKYYGTIGLEFLIKWDKNKDDIIRHFDEYNETFQKKAHGNEVISRVARYYAAVVYTAKLLNEFFKCEIDLMVLYKLFDELMEENKSIDKPRQLLEMILNDLDSDRNSIYYEYEPSKTTKAIYSKGTINLLPAYLKDFLKVEEKAIRSEWLRRGMTIKKINKGKTVDYGQLKHKGRNFSCVSIEQEIIEELGFDFSEDYHKK